MSRLHRVMLALAGGLAVVAIVIAVLAVTGESEQTRTERKVREAFCGKGAKGPTVVCKEKGDDEWSCVAGRSSTVTVTVKDGKVLDTLACAL